MDQNATAMRQEKGYDRVLKELNLQVKEGELLVVIGPVGSGKTSLLLSILRESYLLSGNFNHKRVETAYV